MSRFEGVFHAAHEDCSRALLPLRRRALRLSRGVVPTAGVYVFVFPLARAYLYICMLYTSLSLSLHISLLHISSMDRYKHT